MPSITIRETDNFENALFQFKRECDRGGIVQEYRRREHYDKPTAQRKRAKEFAYKRLRMQIRRDRITFMRKPRIS